MIEISVRKCQKKGGGNHSELVEKVSEGNKMKCLMYERCVRSYPVYQRIWSCKTDRLWSSGRQSGAPGTPARAGGSLCTPHRDQPPRTWHCWTAPGRPSPSPRTPRPPGRIGSCPWPSSFRAMDGTRLCRICETGTSLENRIAKPSGSLYNQTSIIITHFCKK